MSGLHKVKVIFNIVIDMDISVAGKEDTTIREVMENLLIQDGTNKAYIVDAEIVEYDEVK